MTDRASTEGLREHSDEWSVGYEAALRDYALAIERLDVRRVKQAIVNVATKHGIKPDRPHNVDTYSVAAIWGYSAATPDMDAEIAAEYARLSTPETSE